MLTTTTPPDLDEQLAELARNVGAEPEPDEELHLECGYCGYGLDSDGACPFCGATALGGRPDPR